MYNYNTFFALLVCCDAWLERYLDRVHNIACVQYHGNLKFQTFCDKHEKEHVQYNRTLHNLAVCTPMKASLCSEKLSG